MSNFRKICNPNSNWIHHIPHTVISPYTVQRNLASEIIFKVKISFWEGRLRLLHMWTCKYVNDRVILLRFLMFCDFGILGYRVAYVVSTFLWVFCFVTVHYYSRGFITSDKRSKKTEEWFSFHYSSFKISTPSDVTFWRSDSRHMIQSIFRSDDQQSRAKKILDFKYETIKLITLRIWF